MKSLSLSTLLQKKKKTKLLHESESTIIGASKIAHVNEELTCYQEMTGAVSPTA